MPTHLCSAKKSDLLQNLPPGDTTTSPQDTERPLTTGSNKVATVAMEDVMHPTEEGEEVVQPPMPMAELTLDNIENIGKPDVNIPEMEIVHSGTQASVRSGPNPPTITKEISCCYSFFKSRS